MLGKIYTGTLDGINGSRVTIEADISKGLPAFNIVGLPDQIIKEAKERVRTAIVNSAYDFPMGRITLSLWPGDIKKEGTHFDLPLALAILTAGGAIVNGEKEDIAVFGELSLDGRINGFIGCMPMIYSLFKKGIKKFILPFENLNEVSLIKGIEIYPVKFLSEAVELLNGIKRTKPVQGKARSLSFEKDDEVDFRDVKGQEEAKRASLIAVAGFHHILISGSPGTGKTMIATMMKSIMPPLSYEETLEKLILESLSGRKIESEKISAVPPSEDPHHSISETAFIGGGRKLNPGSVVRCNNGLLILNEFPEFKTSVIQQLREPMEELKINIARCGYNVELPCRTLIAATMNPCPCGYFADEEHECSCSFSEIKKYRRKISGPVTDRFDIHINMAKIEDREDFYQNKKEAKTSKEILEIVMEVRERQIKRFKDSNISCNGQMKAAMIDKYIELNSSQKCLVAETSKALKISNRGQHKVLKTARTIADLQGREKIAEEDILEAFSYRNKEW